jgi:hypothetical protein
MEFVYLFHCKDCGFPMTLRAETLGNMFGHPGSRQIVASSVGLVCPQCKKVSNYSLLKNSPDYNHQDLVTWGYPDHDAKLLSWLGCVGENCKSQLPLFAIWNADTTEAERKADISTWRWENLHCPDGHAIEAPQE